MIKYPRTRHLSGSKYQNGDHDLDAIQFADIKNQYIVVEEKQDGANSGISFEDGQMRLQSRGHYLIGGPREKHFDLFKQWSSVHEYAFREVLGEKYVMFGEWMYAKHTVFYDALQHYFAEFDILDKETGKFLSTKARKRLLSGLPVVSVSVLWEGEATSQEALVELVGPSLFKTTQWRENLAKQAQSAGTDPDVALKHTDNSDYMEGLYIKAENDEEVTDRLKYVRADFFNSIMDQGDHWLNRKIIPNMLADGVDIWSQ